MGLCLSRCGDAREQASVTVAPTDSHQDSQLVEKSMITASPYDPNHSLKRFLHLHAGPEPKKLSVSSTPRTSLAELFAAIPHSSELFSLPCSELDRSSFTLSPPADWTIKASSSSHFAFSPKSGFQSGRRIKRIRPARGGEPRDLVAHQRLVDAIARLERLNSGKKSKNFAVLRVGSSFSGPFSGSFCSSDLEPSATMAPKSCSGELLQRPASSVKSRRDVRHYQLPLHLMPKSGTMVEHQMIPLIDVPRLSSEAMPQREPLIISTTSNRRLRSNGFEDMSDSDEMFTFFEASFDEESELVRKHQSRSVRKTSLQRLVQSATQGGCQKAPVVEEFAVMESTKSRRESCKVLVPSSLHPIELLVEQSGTAVSAEAHDVSADPGVESLREEERDESARPAYAETDRNVVLMTKKLPSVRGSPNYSRMRALKGLRRGLSRSLDSLGSSVVHVDHLEFLRTGAARRLSNVELPTEATLIDAKRTELELLVVSSTWSCKLEQSGCAQKEEENSALTF